MKYLIFLRTSNLEWLGGKFMPVQLGSLFNKLEITDLNSNIVCVHCEIYHP